jgi:cation diffusion facilitator family transporter
MFNQQRYNQARRVTLFGALLNFVLAVLKVLFGIVGHSQALVADGIHSFSDLLTDAMVLYASKAANHGPDHDHPYGHGRIETMFTVGLALFLALVGVGIIVEAIQHIIHPGLVVEPSAIVLVVAVISILTNEWLFRYTKTVGTKIKSKLLIANAWHHRSDAFSSIVVLVGVIGTMMGIHFFDAAAAIIVAILIINMSVKMAWSSMKELVDTGIDEAQKADIIKAIRQTPGVEAVHQLRSRLLAGDIFLDVHIQVGSKISVSEGHFIADQVQQTLHDHSEDLTDVIIHIDPEDDETPNVCALLPTRVHIEQEVDKLCHALTGFKERRVIYLDYLSGKLYITLVLPLNVLSATVSQTDLTHQYREALKPLDYLGQLELLFY